MGLAGAGWASRHHLAGWARLQGRAAVVAIADPDIERAREAAAAFGIEAVYGSAEEMLAASRLDALDIATARGAHVALVRLAAAKGIPVLCQKPLAPTLAEAEALCREVSGRIRLMVHENWRFRSHYRQVAAWLRRG